MSGRAEPPAAKRPRSTRPGSAISGSGGKLGGGLGIGGGTANAAVKSKLMEFGIGQKAIDSASTTPPALFFYSNLHDAVRAELQALLRSVDDASRAQSSVTEGGKVDGEGVASATKTTNASASLPQTARARALADVASRARLLERVHAYHSAVEDEVIYPALEAKVANVTLSYQVEHEDEGRLLDELVSLARSASAADAAATATADASSEGSAATSVRLLSRKAAEVEATLGKHLAKEEAQLLPLVLSVFDAREQARLVAQFLCSIPLSAVRETLAWLASASSSSSSSSRRGGGGGMAAATSEGGGGGEDASASAPPLPPSTSVSAQSRIAGAVAGALSAGPLAELVASWLSEEEEGGGDGGEEEEEQEAQERGGGGGGEGEEQRSARPLAACGACAGCGERGLTASASPPPPSCSSTPLRHIAVLHAALGASLMAFAADARALAAAAAASEKRHGGGGGGGGDEEDCSGGGEDENENSDAAASAAAALPAMADRLRFLRSVLAYHAASEDDVLMPVARRLAATAASNGGNGGGGIALSASASAAAAAAAELAAAAIAAEDHHHSTDDDDEAAGVAAAGRGAASQQQKHGGGESACLEHVGTLLNDVRARARRGGARAAVTASLASLAAAADDAASTIRAHMDAEERGVLPALQQALCHGAQAVLLWEALRSMPARVLRQLLPWLGSCLGARAARELVGDACVGAAAPRRGRGGAGGAAAAQRAEARLLRSWCEGLERLGGGGGGGGGGEEDELLLSPPPPSPPGEEAGEEEERKESAAQPGTRKVAATPATAAAATTSDGDAPIDHIFQFHKALRRDLRAMEWQVAAFADALDAVGGSGWRRAKEGEGGAGEEEEEANGAAGAPAAENDSNSGDASPAAARALEGRFRFLQGVYKAHSDAEDNIVFPALEAREALRRVSHAYTLDHEQESALFAEVERHLLRLRGASTLAEARAAARDLAARTAALRASLETHVTAEERELWPLFAENFSAEEQEALVGTIVGRTGAEVLAATLPWVAAATTPREAAAMWESLRSAARGTAFDDWLRASRTVRDSDAPPPPSAADASAPASGAAGLLPASPGRNKPGRAAQPGDALDAVVEYLGLATKGADGGADGFAAGAAVGGDDAAATATPATTSATYRPGWEAIFTMNQAQLESAVRAAWTDESLEPARRAYLAQNIMAARFVVSQQRRASSAQQQRRKEESDGAAAAPSSCGRSHSHQQQQQHQRVSDPAAKAHAASPPPPLPCPHYSRRTRVVAPCCARAHGCRHCHDEAEDHKLVPSQVSSILCAHCGVEGPAGAECSSCGRRQARYYCAICRLWDDTPGRDIYHCPFCNLCRLGKGLGVDAQHCMRCNACMALAEHASHACRRLPEACPACAEPLFDSPRPYRQFPCGHHMHSHCFEKWARGSYACPVCRRSVGDMRAYWKMLDALLERDRTAAAAAAAAVEAGANAPGGDSNNASPYSSSALALPAALASKKQPILCNDCGSKGEAAFHFVYHKCGGCGSYNTTLL